MALQTRLTTIISLVGDGTSTSISINITRPPVNIDVNGNHPDTAKVTFPPGVVATLNGAGTVLTLNLPFIIGNGQVFAATVDFGFPGV